MGPVMKNVQLAKLRTLHAAIGQVLAKLHGQTPYLGQILTPEGRMLNKLLGVMNYYLESGSFTLEQIEDLDRNLGSHIMLSTLPKEATKDAR